MTLETLSVRKTLDVFTLRDQLVGDYSEYLQSFLQIRDPRIQERVAEALKHGHLWPEPLIQINPAFEAGGWIEELVAQGKLHEKCSQVFCHKSEDGSRRPMQLHRHQVEALEAARKDKPYLLTTGTGSGKSLGYIVPIVDHVLRNGSGKGIQAIVVYPMNALANSQFGELQKFLCRGFPEGKPPVTFDSYTGQQWGQERHRILQNPPDILLTNYVMMELILTRPEERDLVEAARHLRFLVLDELHTYRGRQGADVAMLVRRIRNRCGGPKLLCIGTSATLASEGEPGDQADQTAQFASRLFGMRVDPAHVVGETLKRITSGDPDLQALRERITQASEPGTYAQFLSDPLSAWVEKTFGVSEENGRMHRSAPCSLGDGARQLSELTGVPEETCRTAIEEHLLRAYRCDRDPETGNHPFAFRVHQFFSRGDTVYASLEQPAERHLTLHGQHYVPGHRDRLLLPLVFCRECGQEYYSVRRRGDRLEKRELSDRLQDQESDPGFLYLSSEDPWPSDPDLQADRLPEDWLEDGKVRKDRKNSLPQSIGVLPDGQVNPEGMEAWWLPAPFRFCLSCGVAYAFFTQSDLGKLGSLDTGGRSSATTVLSVSALRRIHQDGHLQPEARKLLSFTDNRQDASLQAGHFNDFVEVGLIRSALHRSAAEEPLGLSHEVLTQRVFQAMNLPLAEYSANPDVRFQARKDTDRALREVLGYRIYRDLKGGWRVTSPNLEQSGLLRVEYSSLEELCEAEDLWGKCRPHLAHATPDQRQAVCRTLLDYARRELAVRVDYLDSEYQERLRQLSTQHLKYPWALDEDEELERSTVLYPRSRQRGERRDALYLSARGGFGHYLRRPSVLPGEKPNLEETEVLILQLLAALETAGLVVVADEGRGGVPGYQVAASALIWTAGNGMAAVPDPIRIPRPRDGGGRTNPYFLEFYRKVAAETYRFRAHEHTAQVPYDRRIERENRFRTAELPLLFCSPTMELGVDIAELNVVNMRNVPPTPANYAQRSGRAGRGGQPALVFTYCAGRSPHDQYFFKRPERMVAGSVALPRIDLANEDLLRAHVQAVWLSETGADLRTALSEILDVNGEQPTLALRSDLVAQLTIPGAVERAHKRGEALLADFGSQLGEAPWYSADWLDRVLAQALETLDRSCDRWRDLYRAARRQMEEQNRTMLDASRPQADRNQAARLHAEARSQLNLLLKTDDVVHSDFYSYRYFASEGFLPGYNFPRLPLSAFIPGRRVQDEFLSRARFLAITEFGPRSIVYHEGSKYRVNRVILPPGEDPQTRQVKLCPSCGYLHPVGLEDQHDVCEECGVELDLPLERLLRMQNVSTRRQDRIHSDEEERLRLGYEIVTGVRWPRRDGRPSVRSGVLEATDRLATLKYAQAAELWRINLGWTRRKQAGLHGFLLDLERGYWSSNEQDETDKDDPKSPRLERVIPFVSDTRNSLVLTPEDPLDAGQMASLLAALKSAVQVVYQLEGAELAAELLPRSTTPRSLLLYEAAEGGAGVLQRILDSPDGLAQVARKALELCHFDPDNGADLGHAPGAEEDCEAACYDCLLSYSNQRDHASLDRKSIRDLLLAWSRAHVNSTPGSPSRSEHLADLVAKSGSELERKWLRFLDEGGYHLPTDAQTFVDACKTRPDFLYEDRHAVVYIDGPVHLQPQKIALDALQQECLEDHGLTVIRFYAPQMEMVAEAGGTTDWAETVRRHPGIFGPGRREVEATGAGLDADLFEEWLFPSMQRLEGRGLEVRPGGDVESAGRVIGSYLAELARSGRRVRLLDGHAAELQALKQALTDQGFAYAVVTAETIDALVDREDRWP